MSKNIEIAKKKTVLILGGGLNQIPLCNAARELGYKILLCDSLDNVICKKLADVFLQMDISDPQEIIANLQSFHIDGAVCNTESLMKCLAEVQKGLGLIGNSPQSVEVLLDKFSFRKTVNKIGLFAPQVVKADSFEKAEKYINYFKFPLIIKPEKSSGSRGLYIIKSRDAFTRECFNDSKSNSRNNVILIEDYIEILDKKAIEAEMFLVNGEIEVLCCFRTLRDSFFHTIPQCYCSDTELDYQTLKDIEKVLKVIVKQIGLEWGEYNVELSFTENDEIFIIEINARQGGIKLPDFVNIYSHIDMNKLLVSTSVRDYVYLKYIKDIKKKLNLNVLHYRLLTFKNGIYKTTKISENLCKFLVKEFYYFSDGDVINPMNHSASTVGVLDFIFPNKEIRRFYEENIESEINIITV